MTEAELSRVKSANDSSVMDEGESGCIAGPWMPSHVWKKIIHKNKIVNGTWLDPVEWKKNQGQKIKVASYVDLTTGIRMVIVPEVRFTERIRSMSLRKSFLSCCSWLVFPGCSS